jgi:TolB-like protein
MKPHQQFFAELKRRHVFKVAGVYGVVAFVLLQVADLLGEGLRLPDSFLPFITAVVLLGFPLALILAWAFEVTPDGVQRTAGAAPGEIERIVAAPASKRWPAGLLALVGVGALLAGAWWAGTRMGPGDGAGAAAAGGTRPDTLQLAFAEPDADGRPSIAVLPFLDMSPEGDQAYFSDGITEEILNTLVRVRELKVAARTSAFAFRGRELDMRVIGDSLGVAYLMEGSVRKAGDRLRITAQLIDASDGTHLWSDSYDRTMDDVFAIQTEIAEAIARELRVPLGLDDPDELVTPTADLEAYDLYLAGRARIRERGASLREAVRLFEAAIARDSTWAPAWAALAEAHELRSWYPAAWDEEPEDDDAYNATVARHHAAAEVAAQRALAIDPDIPSARVALGSVYRNRRQWEAAEREYLRALAIDPDNAEAHQQYSEMLGDVGRIDLAVAAAERAVRLDPAPIRRMQYGVVLWADDRPTEAKRQLREGVDLDPENHVPQLRNSLYLMELTIGDFDDLAAFDLPPDLPVTPEQHARLVQAMRAGDKSLMPSEFAEAFPFVVATWAAFGDRERALEAIERRLVESPGGVLIWLWFPNLDPLREDPRFREILELVDLGDAMPQRTPR